MRQKKQYSCRFSDSLKNRTGSIDFKNENLTTKIRRNKAEKQYFFKKYIPKDLETKQIFCYQVLTGTDSSSI